MKRQLLLLSSLLITSFLTAQIFTDNFDSYNAGDYLGLSNPVWDTWSGNAGGNEDVKISDENAMSEPNSLHFKSSSANGGPTDVILRFEEVYDAGDFTLEANIFVVEGKGGYFNFQQNHNVGEVWALECYLLHNGTMKFSNQDAEMLTIDYPTGEWFNYRMEIDLTTNDWEIFINNESKGTFSNSVNSIGIWDIYPVNPAAAGGNGQSEFFIDDVSYNQTFPDLPDVNAGVTKVNDISGLTGQEIAVTAKIRNLGENNIESFDLTYVYADGEEITETVENEDIGSLEFYTHTFSTPIVLAAGTNTLSVTVSNVNGEGQDDNADDDTKSTTITPVEVAPGKIVVGEEATGTWCGWCPRGHVFMDYMETKYSGYWAGIAVHNNDPMVDQTYDTGIGTKIQGYPSALVNRRTAIDPSEMETDFIQEITKAPNAIITNGAEFDEDTRELSVTLTYDFQEAISGNWRIACALTENEVVGTASGYNQTNYYSDGQSGVMGGFENLPSSVPASQMIYQHVARKIEPSFAGTNEVLPSDISIGDKHTVCLTFKISQEWDVENMHIVGMLISPQGRIDNGSYSSVNEAIQNGLQSCDASLATSQEQMQNNLFNVYPNPTQNVSYITFNNNKNEAIALHIVDLTGKTIYQNSYKGVDKITLDTKTFAQGTYIVSLQVGNKVQRQKLIVH